MRTQKQTGAALAVGLILLLVITLIGYSTMKGTMLQEKMAAGLHNRVLAHGGANSAIRDGEAFLYDLIDSTNGVVIEGTPTGQLFGVYSQYQQIGNPASGLNAIVESFKENDWSASGGTSHSKDLTATGHINADLKVNPEYVIQHVLYSNSTGNGTTEFGGVSGTPSDSAEQKAFLVTGKSQSGDGNSFSIAQSLYTVVTDSSPTQ